MFLAPTEENIQTAARAIASGKLVAFPTETVYGLGADGTNAAAVKEIFQLKGRPATNPLILHGSSPEQLLQFAVPTESQLLAFHKLKRFWPGALSVILPRRKEKVPDVVSAGHDTVALRIPNHPVALKLIALSGTVVAAPSANRSNYVSPTTAQHVEKEFGEQLPFILDGGPCSVGIESTVLSLVHAVPTILRLGAVTSEELSAALGCPVDVASRDQSKISPGMLAHHYAPKTPLIFLEEFDRAVGKKIGFISMGNTTPSFPVQKQLILSPERAVSAVARGIYAALRELDESNLDLIVVERCETTGLGLAVLDRLERARAKKLR